MGKEEKEKEEEREKVMSNRYIFLYSILLCLLFYSIAGCIKKQGILPGQETLPKKKTQTGCAECHERLTEVLPEKHISVAQENLPSCIECHSGKDSSGDVTFDRIIHLAHYSIEDSPESCWSCHEIDRKGLFRLTGVENKKGVDIEKEIVEKMNPYFLSWATSDYLDNKHAEKNINCRPCHDSSFPDWAPTMDECLTCHVSYEHISELTKDVEPNPHLSHYIDLRCTVCHKSHEASKLYCDKCHKFDLKVP